MKAYLIRKSDNSFLPAFPNDLEKLKRIKIGEAIEVSFSKPRNYKNHRRFFAMLNMAIQNMPDSIPDRYQNIEYFRYELLIGIGHCEFRESMGGSTYPVAKSMSFSSMGEDEFNDMFALCSNYILKWFLPGLDHATFNENLSLFM